MSFRQWFYIAFNWLHRLNLCWIGLKHVIQTIVNRRGVATRLRMHLDVEFNAEGFVFFFDFFRILGSFVEAEAAAAALGCFHLAFRVNHGLTAERIDPDDILWLAFLVVAGGRQDGVFENTLGLIEVIRDCGACCGGGGGEANLALVVYRNLVWLGCWRRSLDVTDNRFYRQELLAEKEHHNGRSHCSVGKHNMNGHGCGIKNFFFEVVVKRMKMDNFILWGKNVVVVWSGRLWLLRQVWWAQRWWRLRINFFFFFVSRGNTVFETW